MGMRVREHFLLGTEDATISVTAKRDCKRQDLFRYAVAAIMTRYQEEFGEAACRALVDELAHSDFSRPEWRLNPEDSCWNQV
jgi:uncharacterized protein YllA (UPF0747 family)